MKKKIKKKEIKFILQNGRIWQGNSMMKNNMPIFQNPRKRN